MLLVPLLLQVILAGEPPPPPSTPPPALDDSDPADASADPATTQPSTTTPSTTTPSTTTTSPTAPSPTDEGAAGKAKAAAALVGQDVRVRRKDGGVVDGRLLSLRGDVLTLRERDDRGKRVMRLESVAAIEALPVEVDSRAPETWTLPAVAACGFAGGLVGGAGGCLVGWCPGAAVGAGVCGATGGYVGALGLKDQQAALVVAVAAGVGGVAGGLAGFALPSVIKNKIPDPGSPPDIIAITAVSAGVAGGAGALVCGLAAAWTERELAERQNGYAER